VNYARNWQHFPISNVYNLQLAGNVKNLTVCKEYLKSGHICQTSDSLLTQQQFTADDNTTQPVVFLIFNFCKEKWESLLQTVFSGSETEFTFILTI